ncbi:MAG: M23 family metallopeptidase [Niabella sp.]|nr:M23 family metallopeptidase [Niabella sp.]
MAKHLLLSVLLLMGAVSYAQLYHQPEYPKDYFRWPTELQPDIVANMGELRPNHWHMGLDVRTNQKENQRVVAAADGYIAFVGIESLSWGRWIIINHPNGLSTLYGHLNDFRPDLEEYVKNYQYQQQSWETHLTIPPGKFPVKKGDFISFSGSTGGSEGPHVHWEIIDTRSTRRLNPDLFGMPFTDNTAPTITRLLLYDRNNSTYDQYPVSFPVARAADGTHTVPGGIINTPFNNLGFAIQAYDTWGRPGSHIGIYSARVFLDGREISSFYIDSISYADTRYLNAQIDYKMKATGGGWAQHTSRLPGDRGSVYYDLGRGRSTIKLTDQQEHTIRIDVSDTRGHTTTLAFKLKNAGTPPPEKEYEWLPNRLNRIFKDDFEAYLPMFVLYDKMNSGYAKFPSSGGNSISAKYKLGETFIPAHSDFEIRIKPEKQVAQEERDRVVIRRTGGNGSSVKKAVWNGPWLTAPFRDFGTYEAFIDNTPPVINSIDPVHLRGASRIAFTPTDNFGIAAFRATIDDEWIRFTNDKGRTYLYYFDEKVPPGEHTLKVTVTDIAGNKTVKSWNFTRNERQMEEKAPAPKHVATKTHHLKETQKKHSKTTSKSTGNTKHSAAKKTSKSGHPGKKRKK